MDRTKAVAVTGGNRSMGLETRRELAAPEYRILAGSPIWLAASDEAAHSGGYHRRRRLIGW